MLRSGNRDQDEGAGVRFSAQTLNGTTVVVASGELDASNIHYLTDYMRSRLKAARSLVLDLSQLTFLGAQGIRNLFELEDLCQRRGIEWALVPSRPVSRLLRICDEHARLPSASSIDQALERFSTPPIKRALLQLVTKSR
jgi:anti-anti-sigma factor